MKWIQEYDLFLFDFDGLLVNTEHLHFQAYQAMCRWRGVELTWDFEQYCAIAHADAKGLNREIYAQYPALVAQEPRWEVLYAEKKAAYFQILSEGGMKLMPGVEGLLIELERHGIRRCVATNSFREQTETIKKELPVLQTIPVWITREDYSQPKPAPDAYLAALKRLSQPGDRVIGFEDTMRGWRALQAAGVKGVIVSSCLNEEFQKEFDDNNVLSFPSFEVMLASSSLA
jgi:beta-phosphoglucomutase